jgi:glycosyltransferase involved in cell wall biosynthesis
MPTNSSPKKILYVENGIGYGGAIICLRHLVRNIDRTRFTPMVVTGRTGPQYREIVGEAEWKYIPDRHIDIVGAHTKIDPVNWIDNVPGLRFITNQILARADDLFNFLPFFLHLLWTAWRFKADLMHANNEPLCNRAALLVGKVLKIPTLCHVRGQQDGSRLMQWAFGLPDHFTPVSHWVSKSIQDKLGVTEEKITVIYDGLELDELDPNTDGQAFRQQHTISDADFAVGLVGLLIPWKGQEIFLDAAKQLKETLPNIKMLIIGGTPDDCTTYEAMLKERVKTEGLNTTIIFTGHVSDMPAVYNGLDVVVSASTSPEPLGTVVIESMALGRPLIGPNHGGAAEMMQHQTTGLLFEHGNATALAQQIRQLHQQPELAQLLGANARRHALATFAVATHVEHMQNLYTQLLETKNDIKQNQANPSDATKPLHQNTEK